MVKSRSSSHIEDNYSYLIVSQKKPPILQNLIGTMELNNDKTINWTINNWIKLLNTFITYVIIIKRQSKTVWAHICTYSISYSRLYFSFETF